jgi:hypothetical protein
LTDGDLVDKAELVRLGTSGGTRLLLALPGPVDDLLSLRRNSWELLPSGVCCCCG